MAHIRAGRCGGGRNPRPWVFWIAQPLTETIWNTGALFQRSDVAALLVMGSLEPGVVLRDESSERWMVARTPLSEWPTLLHLDEDCADGTVLVPVPSPNRKSCRHYRHYRLVRHEIDV